MHVPFILIGFKTHAYVPADIKPTQHNLVIPLMTRHFVLLQAV
ncbi:hypothetical protein B4129_2561 [Bacillus safensis]|nr:hypothetical protein B4129_2561 [Bacillus safensis]